MLVFWFSEFQSHSNIRFFFIYSKTKIGSIYAFCHILMIYYQINSIFEKLKINYSRILVM